MTQLLGGTRGRRETAPWTSPSRNYILDLDPDWLLLNIPKRVLTRVDTRCVFCRLKIGRGQYRYRFSNGFSRSSNHKLRWWQMHEHCYFSQVVLSIERLKRQLPSNRGMG